MHSLKALRHGSHSFTCKYTMPALAQYAVLEGKAEVNGIAWISASTPHKPLWVQVSLASGHLMYGMDDHSRFYKLAKTSKLKLLEICRPNFLSFMDFSLLIYVGWRYIISPVQKHKTSCHWKNLKTLWRTGSVLDKPRPPYEIEGAWRSLL